MSEINQLHISFNSISFIAEFTRKLALAVNLVAGKLKDDLNSSFESVKKGKNWEIMTSYTTFALDEISQVVGTENLLVFIENYGTGSAMSNSNVNPWLSEYIGSEWWNPVRTTHTVVGRPKGDYISIDWKTGNQKTKTSKGHAVGINLEVKRQGNPLIYTPQKGSLAFEHACIQTRILLKLCVDEVFNIMNFNDFIIGGMD